MILIQQSALFYTCGTYTKGSIMDFLTVLTNARLLKSAVSTLSSSELNEVIQKLRRIYDEKKVDEELNEKMRKERMDALNAIKTIMAQNNISASDLSQLAEAAESEKQIRRRVVPPKYKFTDEKGNILTWTGQGRTPTAFLECIKREGKTMDDYLIHRDDE